MHYTDIGILSNIDIESIGAFLVQYPFPTYLHYPNLNRERFANYLKAVLKDTSQNETNVIIMARINEEISGLASLLYLNWDSQHFGIGMAKIGLFLATGGYSIASQIKRALLERVLQECTKQRINFVSCRVSSEDFSTLHALEDEGFRLMDIITVMGKTLTPGMSLPGRQPKAGNVIREYKAEDLPILRNLGAQLYATSRFYADPRLERERVDALQNMWIENSVKHADTTIIIENKGQVAGFITGILEKQYAEATGTKLGFIGLLGVLPEMRGQGYGLQLVNAVLDWFANQRVEIVTVGTQNINYSALGVYQKAGFHPIASLCTFHKWIRE